METSDPLVFSYNKKAMDYLRSENHKKALIYLTKAEEILTTRKVENINKLMGITLNNFGCFYKRTGNPLLALNFLKKALELEKKSPGDLNNLAGTHLNMSAILSNIGDHHKALEHSSKAISLLKDKVKEDPTVLTTLIVAYHNTGIEFELTGQAAEAKKSYLKGLKLAVDNYSDSHPLAVNLKNSLKGLNINRKTISVSPIRNPPSAMPAITRGSAYMPRSSMLIAKLKKPDTVRFITGERLQPMFKQEEPKKKQEKPNKKNELKNIIKEIDLKNSFYTQPKEKPKPEDSKKKTDPAEKKESKIAEKISTATQVEICDNNLFKAIKNNAAIVIQKHCRRFLAKKNYENAKFEKNLKTAEKEMIRAKEKFDKLQNAKKKDLVKDLIPIAFKSKFEGKVVKDFIGVVKGRKKSALPPIPEENDEKINKAILIQKHFRGWRIEKDYKKNKNAAVVIQKNTKAFITRKLYKSILEAVVFIQRFWKKYLTKLKNN